MNTNEFIEITFDEQKITNIAMVADIRDSVLPEIQNDWLEINNRNGALLTGSKLRPRVIEVDLYLDADENMTVAEKKRALAWMLHTESTAELRISTEPDRYYIAKVDGATEVTLETMELAVTTIRFVCPYVYAISDEVKTFSMGSNKRINVVNEGTAPVPPKITVDFLDECGFVSLATPDGVLMVGDRAEVDTVRLPASNKLFGSKINNLNGWSINSGTLPVQDGLFGGDIVLASDGNGITGSLGGSSGTSWHGAMAKRSFSQSAKNWHVSTTVDFGGLTSESENTLGRLDFILLDTAGEILARITFKDGSRDYNYAIPEFWIRDKRVWVETAKVPQPKIIKQFNTKTKKMETKTVKPEDMGKWNNFRGGLSMKYIDNTLTFEINGRSKKVYSVKNASKYIGSRELSSACFWFARYGSYPAIPRMVAYSLHATKHNVQRFVDIENKFQAGDQLVIDNEMHSVELNGVNFKQALSGSSKFFELEPGATSVQINHSSFGGIQASIEIAERFK